MEGVGKAAQTEGVHGGDLQGGGEASCPGDRLVLVAGSCSPPGSCCRLSSAAGERVSRTHGLEYSGNLRVSPGLFFFIVRVLFSAFL